MLPEKMAPRRAVLVDGDFLACSESRAATSDTAMILRHKLSQWMFLQQQDGMTVARQCGGCPIFSCFKESGSRMLRQQVAATLEPLEAIATVVGTKDVPSIALNGASSMVVLSCFANSHDGNSTRLSSGIA
jgi:precorrin-4 methylase